MSSFCHVVLEAQVQVMFAAGVAEADEGPRLC